MFAFTPFLVVALDVMAGAVAVVAFELGLVVLVVIVDFGGIGGSWVRVMVAKVERKDWIVSTSLIRERRRSTDPLRSQVHSPTSSSTATSLPLPVPVGAAIPLTAATPSRYPLSSFCILINFCFSRSSVNFASNNAAKLAGRSIGRLGFPLLLVFANAAADQLRRAAEKAGSLGSTVEGGGTKVDRSRGWEVSR